MAAKGKGKPVKGIAEVVRVTTTDVVASSLHQNNLKLTLKLEDYRKLPSSNRTKDLRTLFAEKDLIYFQVLCSPEQQIVNEFYKITNIREDKKAKFTSVQSSKAFLASQDVPSIFLPGSTPRHGLQSITDLTVLFRLGDRVSVDFAYLRDERTLSYEVRLPPLGKPPGPCLGIVCDTGLDYGYIWNHELGYVHFDQPKGSPSFDDGARVRFFARERDEVNNCKFEVIHSTLARHKFLLDFSGIVPQQQIPRPLAAQTPPTSGVASPPSAIVTNSGDVQNGIPVQYLRGALGGPPQTPVGGNFIVNGVNGPAPGLGPVVPNQSLASRAARFPPPPPGISNSPSPGGRSLYDSFNLVSSGDNYQDLSWELNQSLDLRQATASPLASLPAAGGASKSTPHLFGSNPPAVLGHHLNGFGAVGDERLKLRVASGPAPSTRDIDTQTEPMKYEVFLGELLQDDEILQIVSTRFPDILRELLKK